MKIIVCVKQVPDTNEVRINHTTGTLIRDGVPSIINPDDLNAIEEAVRIKNEYAKDAQIVALCMGPPQADVALREAIAMGCDEAILLSDRSFAGSDTWATATILAAAIKEIGEYDMILCGRQAIDGDTAQVGPEIAEFLDIPQISYVQNVKVEEDSVVAERKLEDGHFVVKSKMPVLLTAIKELNEPRYPHARRIYEAYENPGMVKNWSIKDIEVDMTQIGVKNSPTNVFRSFVPTKSFNGVKLEGTTKEVSKQIVDVLKEIHAI